MRDDDRAKFNAWVEQAERRYSADLRVQEITRALRALSSAYVERRARGNGQRVHGALDTAGKRAAFALYYGPLHFIAVAEAVRALHATASTPSPIVDLGCGTGAAGAAWAIAAGSTATVIGIDRHPWALSEARWTYAQLGVKSSLRLGNIERLSAAARGGSVIAAYTLNELTDTARHRVEQHLYERARDGGHVIVLEPLARGVTPWWREAARRVEALGGRADEWKLLVDVPPVVRLLGTAAGLNFRELRFQTLFL